MKMKILTKDSGHLVCVAVIGWQFKNDAISIWQLTILIPYLTVLSVLMDKKCVFLFVTKRRNTIAPNIMYIKLKIDVFWSNNNSLPIRPPRTLPEWDPLRNKIRKYPPVQDSEQ